MLGARIVTLRTLRRSALASVLLTLMIFGAACSGQPDVVIRPAATAGTETPSATATASATGPAPIETGTPFPTGQPGQVITTVKDMVTKFGYPPGTNFATLRIPTLGVDARVGARTVGRDAVMPAPGGPADVVWYDLGLWDGMGGSPGGGQNAVFSGHADYADPVPYANVAYRGQAVFSQLHLLSQGDIIELDYRGQTLRYKVEWRRQLNAGGNTDWASIWSSNTGSDAITLYTCGGTFNFQTREYEDRVIVRAVRI
ncbi:MAG: class F sortase [Chloroflexi bacterium]|nr:class F sortase [Chloroflexota bacterium]